MTIIKKTHYMNPVPDIIPVNKVNNLEFIRISDDLRPGQWVEWEVEFSYLSYSCSGFLCACPVNPAMTCDDFIEECDTY